MQLTFTPLAELDLESIADYIATANPKRALTFVQQLRQECQRISINPWPHRRRPELGDNIQSTIFGNYIVFFTIKNDNVIVVRILHRARDIAAIFNAPTKVP